MGDAVELPPGEILVGGEWRTGRGAEVRPINPLDCSPLGELRGADEADVRLAVERGAAAAADPAWRDLLPHQRAPYLVRIADAMEARAERLARLQTLNTGKSILETRALVASAVGTMRYFASVCETWDDDLTAPRGDYLTLSVQEPIGVIGAINAWNSPIASDAQKIAPALAAGNAVVVKPAEWTPWVSLELGRIITETGLPDGLLSVLPGPGRVVGAALMADPGIGKIVFTGGTETGRRLATQAGERLLPISLELGGKSPVVILDDADVDAAVAGVMYGVFSSSGQSCIAGSRVFVPRHLHDDFVARLVGATARLRLGDGLDERTQVGPLVHPAHRATVASFVDLAREEGAVVECGGRAGVVDAHPDGAFYEPTVLTGLGDGAEVVRQEIFGPVVVVLPYDDEDELVARANDSGFGLAAGIWSRSFPRAWRLARRLQAGTVWVNTYKQFSISTPFGGVKDSGLGREKGRQALAAYSQQKGVFVGLSETPMPWAEVRSDD